MASGEERLQALLASMEQSIISAERPLASPGTPPPSEAEAADRDLLFLSASSVVSSLSYSLAGSRARSEEDDARRDSHQCPSCNERFQDWASCRSHIVFSDCLGSEKAGATSMEALDALEVRCRIHPTEHRAAAAPALPAAHPPATPAPPAAAGARVGDRPPYRCPGCGEGFGDWELQRSHLVFSGCLGREMASVSSIEVCVCVCVCVCWRVCWCISGVCAKRLDGAACTREARPGRVAARNAGTVLPVQRARAHAHRYTRAPSIVVGS